MKRSYTSAVAGLLLSALLLASCSGKDETATDTYVHSPDSVSATESAPETESSSQTSRDRDEPSIDLSFYEDEFLTDVESQALVIFAETNFDTDSVDIIDGDGNVLVTLYDDGNYVGPIGDIGGDRVYSGEIQIDTSSVCSYDFQASAVLDGETIRSDVRTVNVYEYITDQDWENMEAADDAIVAFLNSPEYTSLDGARKPDAVIDFLNGLSVNGVDGHEYSLVIPGSISRQENDDITFLYACGVEGCVGIDPLGADSTVPVG